MAYNRVVLAIIMTLAVIQSGAAGPITYGICQTGCNVVAAACYSAAGVTFGAGKCCCPIKF